MKDESCIKWYSPHIVNCYYMRWLSDWFRMIRQWNIAKSSLNYLPTLTAKQTWIDRTCSIPNRSMTLGKKWSRANSLNCTANNNGVVGAAYSLHYCSMEHLDTLLWIQACMQAHMLLVLVHLFCFPSFNFDAFVLLYRLEITL